MVRDLELEAPVDHFPSWDPWGGDDGSWNARFDALSIVTGSNIWIDHCTFTDGRFPNSEAPEGFHGEPVDVNAVAERKFEAAGTEPPARALEEFTTDVGRDPAEAYDHVLAEAGAGLLPITEPAQ